MGPRFIISLDWDDTFTKSPRLWEAFLHTVAHEGVGAQIIIVTMRREDEGSIIEEWVEAVNKHIDLEYPLEVFFTGRKAKKQFMEELGIRVDIWIDDRPEWVLEDALS